MKETQTIQDWLAARQPVDADLATHPDPQPCNPAPPNSGNVTLDERHKTVLRQLLQRLSWPLGEMRKLTSPLGLMPLACLATLNEWATENFNDVLFEGEEIIKVNTELKQRIQI